MHISFGKKQNDEPVTTAKNFFSVNTRKCCSDNPVATYSSAMGEGFVVCAPCELVFLRAVPRLAREKFVPAMRHPIHGQPVRDPWSGNPDTDKYWSNP